MSKILKNTIEVYENSAGDTFLYINDELIIQFLSFYYSFYYLSISESS